MSFHEIGWNMREQYTDLHTHSLYPEPQHSCEWLEALGGIDNHSLTGVAWAEEGRLLAALPAFTKQTPLGSIMVSLPFPDSYGGVIVRAGVDVETAYSVLLDRLVEQAREQTVDVIQIGQPALRDDHDLYLKYLKPDLAIPEMYHYLELGHEPLARASSKRRTAIRRELRKAQASDVRITTAADPDTLRQVYREVLCSRFNDFGGGIPPSKLYEAVFHKLAPKGMLKLFCARQGAELIGGCIVLFSTFTANLYERVVVSSALPTGACALLDHHAMAEAIAHGCRYYNLGLSPTDGVIQYKMRWGASEGTRYRFVKLISTEAVEFQALKKTICDESSHYLD